jgi:membrane dipeptidase
MPTADHAEPQDLLGGTTRRTFLRWMGAGVATAGSLPLLNGCGDAGAADATDPTQIVMDGHVHVTNRIYWEGIDPWAPNTAGGGWDFARAWSGGVNCIIENIGTYATWNYDYSPKQSLRLIETLLKFATSHSDKMAIALSPADARSIIASGRMAVFIGCESGFDHEGDTVVLEALHRLGLRTVQFATQTGFNAFADSATAPLQGGQAPNFFGGINDLGRKLVATMNDLGILIDLTHGTPATMAQVIDASRAPVVASHEVIKSVAGTTGITDDLITAIANKGGLVGIHGAGISKRYAQWAANNPALAAAENAPVGAMIGYQPSFPRLPGDHGEYITRFDAEFQGRWRALNSFKEDPSALPFLPTADEWAEHVDYVIKLVGADHVAIGLDMVPGRTAVLADASGYPNLVAALGRITTAANIRKITGENYMRIFSQVQGT